MAKTYLEVIGAYGPHGWQDADGMEYFNDRVSTEHGFLGKLKSVLENGYPVIIQADEVVLIRRNFPNDWGPTVGVSVEPTAFGFDLFTLVGKNGMVRYQLLDDELEWKNPPKDNYEFDPERLAKFQIGVRTYSKWTPMVTAPDRIRNKVTTTIIKEAQ